MLHFENELRVLQEKYPPLQLIIFTDPGLDDALMLLQILCAKKYRIAGIIPVAGNVDRSTALKNALGLCALAERVDINVYPGTFDKIHNKQEDISVYGASGLSEVQLISQYSLSAQAESGIEFAIELLKDTPCVIISTAILTEPAFLLEKLAAETPMALKHIVAISMMGGVVNFSQEANWPIRSLRSSEANVAFDALASHHVFEICKKNQIPIFLSPLDLTHAVLASKTDLSSFDEAKSPAALFAKKLIYNVPLHYQQRYERGPDLEYRQPLHDVHASHCLLHPELYNGQWVNLIINATIYPKQLEVLDYNKGNVFLLDMHYLYRRQFFNQFLRDLEEPNS
jgi:inosine-uridine nucleoside N-ribohydrolase